MKQIDELEQEYVERRLASCVASLTMKLSKAKRRGSDSLTRRLAYWTEALNCHRDHSPHEGASRVKKMYAKELSKAVRNGQAVGKAVEGSDAYRKTVENRRRYEKGRHTSFANRSAAIDASMMSKHGYKAKRQDGKPMTPKHLSDIEAIVTDFESVVGPIADLFAKTDLTIAHTNGKHPFMQSSGGVYHPKERTISVGVVVAETPVRSGAHELAHWLDAEAGSAMGASTYLLNKSGHGGRAATYLSEFVGHYKDDPEQELLANASRSMNRRCEAYQAFSSNTERTVERDRVRATLGPYWLRKCEIYARLVTQWIATKLGRSSSAADSPEVYQSLPGNWTKADFLRLLPSVVESVERRIAALRGVSQSG